jgi:hypothetical protein
MNKTAVIEKKMDCQWIVEEEQSGLYRCFGIMLSKDKVFHPLSISMAPR